MNPNRMSTGGQPTFDLSGRAPSVRSSSSASEPGVDEEARRYREALARLDLPAFAPLVSGPPFVVALEGPNGVGKSTLGQGLAEGLGVPVKLGTDDAWFSEPFKVRMIRDADWYSSAMFFLSGCFEQMRLLRSYRDRVVVLDRCLWSTLAVHAAERVERLEAVIAMLRPVSTEIQVPDLTIVLDASFATCQARIANKTGIARVLDDLTGTAVFHAREREFYRWLSNRARGIRFLDADGASPAEVVARALAIVQEVSRC